MITDFRLKNIDDSWFSLAENKDTLGFVIVFFCNHCPYANAYEQRLVALHEKYADKGFPVIAINSNDPEKHPVDSFENMKKRAVQNKLPFPYLFDETQETAHQFGAERTPHVFILKRTGDGGLAKVYSGAIDDNWKKPSEVKNKYVEQVLDALLENQPVPVAGTPAVGCTIKWKEIA